MAADGSYAPRIMLCLSGGGFRATLFHLGVVRALRDLNLLNNIACIASVSGGSVLAAHLLLNWQRYISGGPDAAKAESEIEDFVQRDVRGRVLRRFVLTAPTLLLPKSLPSLRFGLEKYLEREYEQLYRARTIADAYKQSEAAPELHVLATNLMTGDLVSFSRRGYHVETDTAVTHVNDTLPMAFAVTASSAFPPLFPPVLITRDRLAENERDFPISPQPLTDAGVFDNTGVEKALRLSARDEVSIDTLILSDAGAPFDWSVGDEFAGIVSRNVRATNILMNRVSQMTLDNLAGRVAPVRFVHIPIQCIVEPSEISVDTQKKLAFIRTDLDAFDDREIFALTSHGAQITKRVLRVSLR